MPTFSANELRSAMEVGSTSHWVISFGRGGANSPDPDQLNFIKTANGDYSPVADVDYDQIRVKKHSFTVGPGLEFSVPYLIQTGTEVKVTFYDDHVKRIRNELKTWLENSPMANGRAIPLATQKDYALLMTISHFDKQHNSIEQDDVFYVVPDESIAFRGDQEFQADSLPISFNILGTQ